MGGNSNRKYVTRAELIETARALIAKEGGQAAVAGRVGYTQPRISQALRDERGSEAVLFKILEVLGGYTVREAFELEPPTKTARPVKKTKRAAVVQRDGD